MIDTDWDVAGRIAKWRNVLRSAAKFPTVLAAAIAWDAWIVLNPEERGPWRAPMLAALYLKVRGKSSSFLLPLDLGRRMADARWVADDPIEGRLSALCRFIGTAAVETATELDQIEMAEGMLRRYLIGRRKTSRLPQQVDLVLARPLVSLRMIAKTLRISKQAAAQMIRLLGSTPRELTDRSRYRCWAVISARRR